MAAVSARPRRGRNRQNGVLMMMWMDKGNGRAHNVHGGDVTGSTG